MLHFLGGFRIEAHIQIVYGVYTAPLHLFPVAPVLVGADKLAELGAVVAKMIYSDRLITEKIEYLIERTAYRSCGKMSYMERFGDVYGGIIYAYRLACAFVGRAVLSAPFKHLVDSFAGKCGLVYREVDISVYRLCPFDYIVGWVIFRDGLSYNNGALAHDLCKFETGQRIVAHF